MVEMKDSRESQSFYTIRNIVAVYSVILTVAFAVIAVFFYNLNQRIGALEQALLEKVRC